MSKRADSAPPRLVERLVRIDDILDDGLSIKIDATKDEKEKLAAELNLLSLDSLTAQLELRRKSRGRLAVRGTLKAGLSQACVVSLEPVVSRLSEEIDTEYWPEAQIETLNSEQADNVEALDLEPLAADGPEPIIKGEIDIGQLVYETLATMIEPFPRKAGAKFSYDALEAGDKSNRDTSSLGGVPKKESPFAILEKLKKPGSKGDKS